VAEQTITTHTPGNPRVAVWSVKCEACKNQWWVRRLADFLPNVCCYCGTRFTSMKDHQGHTRPYRGAPPPPEGP